MAEGAKKGELEKLTIQAHAKQDYSDTPVAKFKVFFNPDEFGWAYDVEYEKKQGQGTTGSPLVFKKIKPRDYNLKFFFDGTGVTGEKIAVEEKIQEFFKVVGYNGDIHRPPYLKLLWGNSLELRCVLQKADITYKMFSPDGRPLRAIINAKFIENIDDKTRVAKANDKSTDLMQVRIVKEGDTLPRMAYEIYGDPSYYLELARVNKLNHFRQLQPGEKIFFPPVEKVNK